MPTATSCATHGGLRLFIFIGILVVEGAKGRLVVGVRLEAALGSGTSTDSLVLVLVIFCLVNHALDPLLGWVALVVGDSDDGRLPGGLIGGGDVQETVGVSFEGNLDLRNAMESGGGIGELELAESLVLARSSS